MKKEQTNHKTNYSWLEDILFKSKNRGLVNKLEKYVEKCSSTNIDEEPEIGKFDIALLSHDHAQLWIQPNKYTEILFRLVILNGDNIKYQTNWWVESDICLDIDNEIETILMHEFMASHK